MICWRSARVVLGAMRLCLSRGAERPAPRTPSGARTPGAFFFGGAHCRSPVPLRLVFFIVRLPCGGWGVWVLRVGRLGARLGVIFRVAKRR